MVETWEPGDGDDYDRPWQKGDPEKTPYLCRGGTAPVMTGPKNKWYEALPGFWLPVGWSWTEEDFPDYSAAEYIRILDETPNWNDIIKLGPPSLASRRAWGAWMGAWGCDRVLKRGWPELESCARMRYESARYVFLVPLWTRLATELMVALDDVEDQISTILWALETVSKKWVPVPPGMLGVAKQTARALDCAQALAAGATGFRVGKSKYVDCLSEVARKKATMRTQNNQMLGWLQENYGRIIEAAQASNTWFDVGLVLGPIFAWLEEGSWGLIRSGAEGYNLSLEALFPGYIEERNNIARSIDNVIEEAWNESWGSLDEWDNKTIGDWVEL